MGAIDATATYKTETAETNFCNSMVKSVQYIGMTYRRFLVTLVYEGYCGVTGSTAYKNLRAYA